MKFLIIMIDMLRAENQQVVNPDRKANALDAVFYNLGGIVYANCLTPAPDTPRSTACMYSGCYPKRNNCYYRIRYPRYYLNDKLDNLWKMLERNAFDRNVYLRFGNIRCGELPMGVENRCNMYTSGILSDFLDNAVISEHSANFIYLDDLHLALDDIQYDESRIDFAYNLVARELDMIFSKYNKDDFDFIVIFSDHGFMKMHEVGKISWWHRARTQTYLQIRLKGENTLRRSNELVSIMDIFPTISNLIGEPILNPIDGLDLFGNVRHPYLLMEDHKLLNGEFAQYLDWWGVVTPNKELYTDTSGRWYVGPGVTQEDMRKYHTILCAKASQYEDNLKYHQIHTADTKTRDITQAINARYSTGELRRPVQANADQSKEEPHADETATNESAEESE